MFLTCVWWNGHASIFITAAVYTGCTTTHAICVLSWQDVYFYAKTIFFWFLCIIIVFVYWVLSAALLSCYAVCIEVVLVQPCRSTSLTFAANQDHKMRHFCAIFCLEQISVFKYTVASINTHNNTIMIVIYWVEIKRGKKTDQVENVWNYVFKL